MYSAELTATVREDLRLSSGMGQPLGIDSSVTRQSGGAGSKGKIIIRRSHLHGVLSANALQWAELREEAAPDGWPELARQLFGDGPLAMRRVQVSDLKAVEGEVNAWQTTARQKHSRRPEDNTLRSFETVAAGTQFKGELWVEGASLNDKERLMLQAVLDRTTALGGSRERGWGRVKLEVQEVAESVQQLSWPTSVGDLPAASTDVVVRVHMTNLDALLITDTQSPGNYLPTMRMLPGAALRGAWLTWLRAAQSPAWAERMAACAKFGDGHAIPKEAIGGTAGLTALQAVPMPKSLREKKPQRAEVDDGRGIDTKVSNPTNLDSNRPWWSMTAAGGKTPVSALEDSLAPKGTAETATKRIKGYEVIWRTASGAWQRHSPKIEVLLRNRVDLRPSARRDGRATTVEDTAALFTEERLCSNQEFVSDVVMPQVLAEEFMSAVRQARPELRMGRGGARVAVTAVVNLAVDSPAPVGGTAGSLPDCDLDILLTSDLAVRLPDLTWAATLGPETWRTVLGDAWPRDIAVKRPSVSDGRVAAPSEVSETHTLRGFNRASGLPRAPVIAIAAGSVVRLAGTAADIAVARALLQARASAGQWLGERTEDGLGRFALDLKLRSPAAAVPSPADSPKEAP